MDTIYNIHSIFSLILGNLVSFTLYFFGLIFFCSYVVEVCFGFGKVEEEKKSKIEKIVEKLGNDVERTQWGTFCKNVADALKEECVKISFIQFFWSVLAIQRRRFSKQYFRDFYQGLMIAKQKIKMATETASGCKSKLLKNLRTISNEIDEVLGFISGTFFSISVAWMIFRLQKAIYIEDQATKAQEAFFETIRDESSLAEKLMEKNYNLHRRAENPDFWCAPETLLKLSEKSDISKTAKGLLMCINLVMHAYSHNRSVDHKGKKMIADALCYATNAAKHSRIADQFILSFVYCKRVNEVL